MNVITIGTSDKLQSVTKRWMSPKLEADALIRMNIRLGGMIVGGRIALLGSSSHELIVSTTGPGKL